MLAREDFACYTSHGVGCLQEQDKETANGETECRIGGSHEF